MRRYFILTTKKHRIYTGFGVSQTPIEVNKMKGEKDSENKRFIATLAVIGAAAIGMVAGVLASAIGGNTKIEMNDDEELK